MSKSFGGFTIFFFRSAFILLVPFLVTGCGSANEVLTKYLFGSSSNESIGGPTGGPTLPEVAPVEFSVPKSCVWLPDQSLDFEVRFNQSVEVSGEPRLGLQIGSSAKHAAYLSGSGTDRLKFRYTVQPGDLDPDGVSVESQIDKNAGDISSVEPGVVDLSIPAELLNLGGVKIGSIDAGELRGHWKLNEGGTGPVVDSSSFAHSTSAVGAPEWVTENGRKYLRFNGTADWFTAGNPAALAPTTGITVSGWIRPESDYGMIVSSGNHNNYYLLFTERKFQAFIRYPVATTITTVDQYPLNSWYHVAMTYDRSNFKLYVNGVQVQSVPLTAAIGYSGWDQGFRLGTYLAYGAPWAPVHGGLRDIRVYGAGQNSQAIESMACGL